MGDVAWTKSVVSNTFTKVGTVMFVNRTIAAFDLSSEVRETLPVLVLVVASRGHKEANGFVTLVRAVTGVESGVDRGGLFTQVVAEIVRKLRTLCSKTRIECGGTSS